MSSEAVAQQKGLVKRPNLVRQFFYHAFTILEMEFRKLRKDQSELIMRGFQPALWLLVFGQAFSRFRVLPEGSGSYMEFLTPGILAQSITFISIFYGITIIWERDAGLLQKFLSTPVRHASLIFGKMLSAALRSMSQTIIIIVLALIVGVRLNWSVGSILGLFFSVILGGCFFSGLSLLLAFLVRTRERMMGIGQLITMPLFFASNALYPIDMMPTWLKVIAHVNPMSYLVDSLRGLLLKTYSAHLLLDWTVLVLAVIVVLTLSSFFMKRLAS